MGNYYSFFEVRDPLEGYDIANLGVDEAYLKISSSGHHEMCLYAMNEDCHGCPYTLLAEWSDLANESEPLKINTKHPWRFAIANCSGYIFPDGSESSWQCSENTNLGQFGIYSLEISENDCTFRTIRLPVFEYAILIFALLFYIILAGLVKTVPILIRKLSTTGLRVCCPKTFSVSQTTTDLSTPNAIQTNNVSPKPRIKSLDTFRGLSIALMIFVNYGAGGYWFLEHSTWEGLYVADLVFPWFMWIMGVCIPLGQKSAIRRAVPKRKIFLRILKIADGCCCCGGLGFICVKFGRNCRMGLRSLKLFVLGIILNSLGGSITLAEYRVPGVLQRFAICYLVVASVALFTPDLTLTNKRLSEYLGDMIVVAWQWLFYAVFVAAHIVLMFCLPVPNCPTGYIGPGGLSLLDRQGNPLPDCIGGATGYIDRWILGVQHLYQNPTAKEVYQTGAFDPEGVLGSMLSVFQVFLGLVAGNVLHFHKTDNGRLLRWILWGTICGVIGAILCMAGDPEAPIPVNKNLWSLSYVLVTTCFAFYLLAFFYLMVDKEKWWSGAPLYQAGMNSILLYCGHNITYNLFPWHYIIGSMNTHAELLIECLWGTSLWVIIALYLDHIGKFYTV